jgi:hypothetical protein
MESVRRLLSGSVLYTACCHTPEDISVHTRSQYPVYVPLLHLTLSSFQRHNVGIALSLLDIWPARAELRFNQGAGKCVCVGGGMVIRLNNSSQAPTIYFHLVAGICMSIVHDKIFFWTIIIFKVHPCRFSLEMQRRETMFLGMEEQPFAKLLIILECDTWNKAGKLSTLLFKHNTWGLG